MSDIGEATSSRRTKRERGASATTNNPALVQHVFGHFKDYLSAQLDSQKKKLESKHKIDKDTVELKYKIFHSLFFLR